MAARSGRRKGRAIFRAIGHSPHRWNAGDVGGDDGARSTGSRRRAARAAARARHCRM